MECWKPGCHGQVFTRVHEWAGDSIVEEFCAAGHSRPVQFVGWEKETPIAEVIEREKLRLHSDRVSQGRRGYHKALKHRDHRADSIKGNQARKAKDDGQAA